MTTINWPDPQGGRPPPPKGPPMSDFEKRAGTPTKAPAITSYDEFVASLKSANAAYGSEVAVLTSTYADRIVDILSRVDADAMSPTALQMIMIAEGIELKHKLEQSLAQIGATMEAKLT